MQHVVRLAVILSLCLAGAASAATTYYVSTAGNDAWDGLSDTWTAGANGPKLTIQAAIDVAVNGDEVVILPGTYTGAGNRDLDYSHGLPAGQTRAITVRSTDPLDPAVVDATIIDCAASVPDRHRAFLFDSGEGPTAVVDGLTIKNGYAPTSPTSTGSTAAIGGAIYCRNAGPTIRRCVIDTCTSLTYGGGIGCWSSSARIESTTFDHNFAGFTGKGAGLYVHAGTVTVEDSAFLTNGGGIGGGIYTDTNATLTVTRCVFDNNSAFENGGGLFCNGGTATITDNVFTRNRASTYGGAITTDATLQGTTISACEFDDNEADQGGAIACDEGRAAIDACSFTGNDALEGGAIYVFYFAGAIDRCTFASNTATYDGGGVAVIGNVPGTFGLQVRSSVLGGNKAGMGGALYFQWSTIGYGAENCTIVGNRATSAGGGVACYAGTATIMNTIAWDNRADSGPQIALVRDSLNNWGSTLDASYCDVQGGDNDVFVDTSCTLNWGARNVDLLPLFVDAGYWDDPGTPADPDDDTWIDRDCHLTADSPCRDAGDPSTLVGDDDQDIDGRPRLAYRAIDIGADELMWPADYDLDADADLADFQQFIVCFNGPNRPPAQSDCDQTDHDADGDVDLTDFTVFLTCFNGPNRPPACAP